MYYNKIFTKELNGAKVVLAVLIWRYVETTRKTSIETMYDIYPFIGYASNTISMIIGMLVLKKANINISSISHTNFKILKNIFDENIESFYKEALEIVKDELQSESINIRLDTDSLQRIAGAFRGGYLTQQIINKLI